MSTMPISSVPNVTRDVAQKFHSLRLKFLVAHVAIAVLLAVTGWGLLWLGLAVIDYFLEIQFSWRQLAMWSAIGVTLIFALARLIGHVRHSRTRAFASRLELAFESFGQRIRTVLDTVDGKISGPQEMLAALGHQTLGRWETLVPNQILPKRLLIVSSAFCAGTLAMIFVSLLGQGEWKTAMLRSIGYEIPYTTLSVTPGNIKVLEGKDVAVSLKLVGRQERDVQLRYKVVKGVSQPVELKQDLEDQSDWITSDLESKDSGDFNFEFGQAKDPVEYQFVTSVGNTEVYRIDVQPLIVAVRTEIHTIPPAYTGLEPRTFSATEATVLERSTVTVNVETNHPLKTVQLEIGGRLSKLVSAPAEIGGAGNEVAFELPTTASLHWKLNATGNDGTPMTTLKGRLRVREDAAPSIRWQDPQDEIRVHTLAELPMRAQVSDDYGVVETGIMFRIGDDEEFELTKKSISELTTEDQKITTSWLLDELLPLESFALSERDYISYYAFAIDNREWGNQRVETDVRYIDIRPLRQFFAEIELDPNQNGGGRLVVQLDEIIRRQRHVISRTRKMTKDGDLQATDNLRVIDRMVQAESELAGLARFLSEFLLSRGNDDVEALNQAEASMLQASDSLSAVNLSLALTQEEDALRALAEARRELEIFIVKGNQAQQQQFSQAARRLQQKLRRDVEQTEQQLADTLERIASEQMQLSEQISNAGQSKALQNTSASPNNTGNSSGGGTVATESQETPTVGEAASQPSTDEPAGTDPPKADSNVAAVPTKEKGDAASPSEASSEMSEREQREEWFSRQVELLERVQAIEEQLSSRLEKSKLMTERMRDVKADMDSLSKMARSGEPEPFVDGSREVSDKLRELSVQLAAIAATEAVNRVASLRDMTLSMAERERDLVDVTQRLAASPSESSSQQNTPSGSGNSTSEQVRNGQAGNGQGADPNAASIAEDEQGRAARRLARRAATIADVLTTPTEVGDVAMSEVNDALDKFVEANEFTDKLSQSQSIGEQMAEGNMEASKEKTSEQAASEATSDSPSEMDQAVERARDYADAAAQLETLYRQLVSPRVARLRQLEQQASQLNQELAGQVGKAENASEGTAGQAEKSENSMTTRGKVGQLQRDIKQEGMAELAEALESSFEESGEQGQSRYGLAKGASVQSRVEVVVRELREHIQELILLEVAADRDAPVPTVYRDAVDGYFRTIAGESEEE